MNQNRIFFLFFKFLLIFLYYYSTVFIPSVLNGVVEDGMINETY